MVKVIGPKQVLRQAELSKSCRGGTLVKAEVHHYGLFDDDISSDLLERLAQPAEIYIPVRQLHTLDNVVKHPAIAASIFLAAVFITKHPQFGRHPDEKWFERHEAAMITRALNTLHFKRFEDFSCIAHQESPSFFDLKTIHPPL